MYLLLFGDCDYFWLNNKRRFLKKIIIDEKKAVKEEVEKISIACEDNNIRCQFCTQIFECYKCTAKEERIRILSRANRMKEQTISSK